MKVVVLSSKIRYTHAKNGNHALKYIYIVLNLSYMEYLLFPFGFKVD